MRVATCGNTILVAVSAFEADFLIAAYRALNEKHERERTMSSQLKSQVVDAIMRLELSISDLKETAEPPQNIYDFLSFND
jgi:hypothetical protein